MALADYEVPIILLSMYTIKVRLEMAVTRAWRLSHTLEGGS